MARLDKATRDDTGTRLRGKLPNHWRVTVGDDGYAFLEVDQDGKKKPHEFHTLGTTVLVIRPSERGRIAIERYTRVPHPPGYIEGRQPTGKPTEFSGRGWSDRLVEIVISTVAEADAAWASATEAAEA